MIKYYMRPDSNTPPAYSYCVGEDTDTCWNPDTCIEVPKKPSPDYNYNLVDKKWELNQEEYMTDLRVERDEELRRTDKYMLFDYPILSEDKTIAETYRQALRDCPNKALLADRVLPECPDACKK